MGNRIGAKEFEEAIETLERVGPSPGVHPLVHQAMLAGMRSVRDDLLLASEMTKPEQEPSPLPPSQKEEKQGEEASETTSPSPSP